MSHSCVIVWKCFKVSKVFALSFPGYFHAILLGTRASYDYGSSTICLFISAIQDLSPYISILMQQHYKLLILWTPGSRYQSGVLRVICGKWRTQTPHPEHKECLPANSCFSLLRNLWYMVIFNMHMHECVSAAYIWRRRPMRSATCSSVSLCAMHEIDPRFWVSACAKLCNLSVFMAVCVCVCVCVCECEYVWQTWACVCMCVYVCVCVSRACVCVCNERYVPHSCIHTWHTFIYAWTVDEIQQNNTDDCIIRAGVWKIMLNL